MARSDLVAPMHLNGVKLLQSHLNGKILYCLHCVFDEVGYSQLSVIGSKGSTEINSCRMVLIVE